MKKSILFMSAVAMLAAASCNKPELENVGTTPEVGANEFVAYTESATKTTLNGFTTVWEAEDEIAINGVAYITSEGGERAIFALNDENEPEAPYLAGYPYRNVMASKGTAIDFAYLDVENELILTRNQIGDEVFAMAYNESERSLEFKNVVSLLKFQVPSTFAEEITSITISTNEPLAGYFTAEYNNGVPTWTISEGSASVNEIILTDEQGAFSSEATYFVPVLPGDKTNLTVKLNETVVATGISMKFERNMIHNVAVLPSTEVRKVYLKPDVWDDANAWFAAHFFGAADVDTKMVDSDEDGIYEVAVPNGATGVLFCRMNPDFTEFSWDEGHVWNKTTNLTVPASGASEIYYVITGWGENEGTWMTYDDATAEPVAPEVEAFEAWNGYIYLQPNSNWNEAGARFAAYFFGNGETWASLTLVEGTQNTYGCKIPEGYPNVIFCRMNPDASDNNWNNKWGQTGDLAVADGNLYALETGSWNSGLWMTVEAVDPPVAPEPEEPEVPAVTPGQASEWALAGTFNGWGNAIFKTTATSGLFVIKNLALDSGDEIKVKAAANWDTSYGGGIKNLKQNCWMKVYSNGANIPVSVKGTYDIYFDSAHTKLYLMATGIDYTSATEQNTNGPAPTSPSEWYIVGSFNGWDPGDADYRMSDDGTYYFFDNFTATSGCEMKFAPGKWSGDKGASGSFSANTWLKTGGNNIKVPAGTYKIYLKKDLSQYKFEKK